MKKFDNLVKSLKSLGISVSVNDEVGKVNDKLYFKINSNNNTIMVYQPLMWVNTYAREENALDCIKRKLTPNKYGF